MGRSFILILPKTRKDKKEARSFPHLGFYPDRSAVFLYQSFGDGEAQACATAFVADLIEFVEDLIDFIFWDTDSSIPNLMEDGFIILLACDDLDLSSLRSEFEGIEKEVGEDVVNPIPI